MSEIDNFINKNNNAQKFYINQPKEAYTDKKEQIQAAASSNPSASSQIRDEFVKTKKESGLVGKFYNFLKNKTGIGLGSKKVEAEIDKYERGESSEKQVQDKISQFKISRENAVQQAGDVVAGAISISTFFFANNEIKKLRARYELDALPEQFKDFTKDIKNSAPKGKLGRFLSNIEGIIKSKNKTMAVLIPALALIGGMTKLQFGQLERISSKEFKTDKNLDKSERKAQKKAKRKEKMKANFKNFATGAAAGALAPVTTIFGGIIGVPAYIASIMGIRYAASKNDGKEKSINDFTKSLKDNAVVNTAATALIAIPAFKHANFSKILSTNLEKVVAKLKGKELHLPDLPSNESAYQELENKLINSEAVQNILNKRNSYTQNVSMDDIITELTEENIFAVKFLQIKSGGEFFGKHNPYNDVKKALLEDCPPTRTIEQAQEQINKLWGSAEYQISKLLGVGTVAESYLAKDKSGKEVCIKILKEGITAEKIAKDKQKFLELITGGKPLEQLTDDQKYLVKNIEDLAEGISKEVDFKNEMEAAKALVKHCKVADVVKPITAKDGIYIMEKAPGISVKTLVDYYQCEMSLKWARKAVQKYPDLTEYYTKRIEELEAKMKKIKSRSPEFADFDMTPAQIKRLLKNYINLQVEQFSKINKNGKIIHADIHPGNIFINLESLKTGKGKLFTLIDTGNTITLSIEQAKASLRVTGFIKNGNVKDLSQIVLDGAVLPAGLTKEQALKNIEADLRKFFFDNETKIDSMNIDTFYALSDNILRKYGIIPNNTQLNLNKAKTSASNSFKDLMSSFFNKKYGDKDFDEMSKTEIGTNIAKAIGDVAQIGIKQSTAQSIQETKNLFQMSLKEALNFLRNKNMLKTNSEDYLTYEMKQSMPGPKPVIPEELLEGL